MVLARVSVFNVGLTSHSTRGRFRDENDGA